MKYIHKYVRNKSPFWLVPTDERFEKILDNLYCPESQKQIYLNDDKLRKMKYIFINRSDAKDPIYNKPIFGWAIQPYIGIDGEDTDFFTFGSKYAGKINVTDEELEQFKLNLIAKKYNL